MNADFKLVGPPPTSLAAIGGYPKVTPYDMLDEQLHCSIEFLIRIRSFQVQ